MSWSLSIGLYNGIVLGIREYDLKETKMIVFYIPIIEIIFEYEV